MFLVFSALLEAGEEVIVSDPHYACYPNFIRFVGGQPVFVPVMEEDGFQFRTEEVRKRIAQKTRAILINSPSNPTGAFYVLTNARHIYMDSLRLAFDIAEKVRLGVAPGIDFGVNAEGFLRFSCANSLENLD